MLIVNFLQQLRAAGTASAVLAAGMLLASAMPADAAILAKDSYIFGPGEYMTGNVGGMTGTSPVGFSGGWAAGSSNIQFEGAGILDGDADPANGQGKYIPAGSSAFRAINRQLSPLTDPPGNTFYMSHLVNSGGSGGADGQYAMVGFGSFVAQATIEGTANNLLGAFTGFVNNNGAADLVLRSRTAAIAGGTSDVLLVADAANITYNVVMALEYNNPGDEIRYWVNPTDFTDESTLTSTALVSGSVGGFQLSAVSDMNRLTIATNNSNRSFFWDESILATATTDLGPVAIPEPTAALLSVMGLCGLAFRRRR